MVQRPAQQDRVSRRIGQVYLPRISNGGADGRNSVRVRRQLVNVQADQVTVLGELREARADGVAQRA
jgi:hypothetical protein